MKKLFVLAAAFAMHAAPVVAMERPEVKLSPMVLVELQANMKADLVLAERQMGWEIEDELETQTALLLRDNLTVANVATLTNETVVDLSVQSED